MACEDSLATDIIDAVMDALLKPLLKRMKDLPARGSVACIISLSRNKSNNKVANLKIPLLAKLLACSLFVKELFSHSLVHLPSLPKSLARTGARSAARRR